MSNQSIEAGSNAPGHIARPTTITIAFWAFIASTLLGLANGVVTLLSGNSVGQVAQTVIVGDGTDGADTQVTQVTTAASAGALVFSVIMSLLYILFAAKVRAGRNWARILLTVVAGLQLLAITFGQSTTLGYVSGLCAVVGAVGCFVKPSNDYVAAMKTAR
ncbi:hypothetical protein [Amycolatopsis sp. NPDC051061]|uniref:hypothetical protein n=1 Tax=Amycolatopsis sp. NPDC051061 TaxID=3155042 RepID=UPI00343B70A7